MIKIKIIDLIQAFNTLTRLCKYNDPSISMEFRFKIGMLYKKIKIYIEQYSEELQKLIINYDIEIVDNKYSNKDKDEEKLTEFLKLHYDLENSEIEVKEEKILLDRNIKDLDAYELVNLSPFFNYDFTK